MDIILIGGLWLDPTAWDDVLPALRDAGHTPTPVALPGQGDGRRDATLTDQIDAVLTAIDQAAEPVLVVGHSAACTLAWLAADRRSGQVARAALIGGFPQTDGEGYAPFFEPVDGLMGFPGWQVFEGPDSEDLTEERKARMAAEAHPVPATVAQAPVHYGNPDRYRVPVTLVCPEYSPEQAKAWLTAGDMPELEHATVDYVDFASGHWPMYSAPQALAEVLDQITT